jgi:hypothetical protein
MRIMASISRGRTRIADAKAGHRESLREAVEEDRPFPHAGQRRDGGVRLRIGKFGVNLVRDDEQVVLAADGGDFFQLRRGHDAAGGIAGEIDQQHFRLRRDGGAKRIRAELEFILLARGDGDGLSIRERDARTVGDVAWFVIKHLVAGIQDGAQGEIERLGNADGDEHFGRGIVPKFVVARDVIRDGRAQGEQAEVGGVTGFPALERVDGGLADVPGGDEIGLADAERDDALHGLHDLEKIADAGARDVAHMIGDEVGGSGHGNGGNGEMHGKGNNLMTKFAKLPNSKWE